MSWRYDYIMNQIEKACQLIAALIASKKVEHKEEANINQTLADLTGFGLDTFTDEKNAAMLPSLLAILDDDNKKALAAILLRLKNKELYRDVCTSVLAQIDDKKLHPEVRKMILQDTKDFSKELTTETKTVPYPAEELATALIAAGLI